MFGPRQVASAGISSRDSLGMQADGLREKIGASFQRLLKKEFASGIVIRFASQAAWHRMENGPKKKIGRKWDKICRRIANGPLPEMGQNGEKMGFGVIFHFFAIFGPFFSPFGRRAIFYFSAQFFPIFGFRPIFHSRPGGLTLNMRCTKGLLTALPKRWPEFFKVARLQSEFCTKDFF